MIHRQRVETMLALSLAMTWHWQIVGEVLLKSNHDTNNFYHIAEVHVSLQIICTVQNVHQRPHCVSRSCLKSMHSFQNLQECNSHSNVLGHQIQPCQYVLEHDHRCGSFIFIECPTNCVLLANQKHHIAKSFGNMNQIEWF